MNIRKEVITVSEPTLTSLSSLREEVRSVLPYPDAPGSVSPQMARKALSDAINGLSDAELRKFRGAQIVIAM
jgi:hypothetical protein